MAFHRNQEQQQQQQLEEEEEKNLEDLYLGGEEQLTNSGLARYRSAPSSYFSNFLDGASNVNVNSTSSRGGGGGGDYSVDDLDNFLDGLMPSNQISFQQHGSSSSNNRFSSSKRMTNSTQFPVASKQDCYRTRDHQQDDFIHVNDSSYRFSSSMDKSATNSNLFRYNSSPAGLFSGLNIAHGGGLHWSSGLMSCVSETADRSIGQIDNEVENGVTTSTFFPSTSTSTAQLSRHLSMPTTSTELYGVETLMQDSVLCKFRAKRGCATHPRSIAERVRRTKISERMRKLQQLVPNMEKQSNTSDMLDLAVDYIKGLQRQLKTLSEKRAHCTCSEHL